MFFQYPEVYSGKGVFAMAKIHPGSVVCDGAELAADVEIGPFCYVGPHVKLGEGCRLIGHVNIGGYTSLGCRNVLYPFAALGQPAQDHAVTAGARSYLRIGDDNIFREGFTAHTGTKPESETVIGSRCMFMNHSHVAHNCVIGDDVIFVNSVAAAGYSQIMDHAILSGLVGIHQFCRVGRYAIISGGSVFSKDVPPFMMAEGRNGGVKMINLVGLKRAGFPDETIRVIREIFKIYYHSNLAPGNALKKIAAELPQIPEVKEFLDFCAGSVKGVLCNRAEAHRS